MSKTASHTPKELTPKKTIFVTVLGGVAEVDYGTVPAGIEVEIVDVDSLRSDTSAFKRLSTKGRAYVKDKGYI